MVSKNLSNEEIIKLLDGPLKKSKSSGEYKYATFSQPNHCIYIKFDKMFNREDIKQHNVFRIQYKRYYSEGGNDNKSIPMLPAITDNINTIMNRNNDSQRLYAYIAMKIALKEESEYSEKDFKRDILKLIKMVSKDIVNYIDENYTLNLDANNEKINVDLQVTDEMNKVYIRSAVGCRFVIPLICIYTANNKIDDLFYKLFRSILLIFSKCSTEDTNPLTKLTSIVRSRVESTKYANKKIWKLIGTHTNDMQLVRYKFTINLIEHIIPKLEINKSSIIYIDVVLKRKLTFEFTYNFPYEFKPLRNLENDDDTDERDRLNEIIFTSRKDEASLVLNKLTIKKHISEYINEYGITDKDIDDFKKSFNGKNINNIQNYFLFIKYGKLFEVKIANEKDRLILLHELITELNEEGFTELPKILSSIVENEIDIRNKVIGKKLKNQSATLKIIKKYQDVIDIIENDNFIAKMASFKSYNYFNSTGNIVEIDSIQYEREICNFLLSLE